jgi:hypothetical protein
MTDTFRELCAELVDWVERASDLHRYGTQDLITRARAALAQSEPEPLPDTDVMQRLLSAPMDSRGYVDMRSGCAALAEPEPEGEELTDALVDDLFNRFADSCDEYGLWSMGKDGLREAIAALAEPEPQGELIPDRYSGYQKTIYKDGFHAGYKHGLNSASAALAKPEPVGPTDEEIIRFADSWEIDTCLLRGGPEDDFTKWVFYRDRYGTGDYFPVDATADLLKLARYVRRTNHLETNK